MEMNKFFVNYSSIIKNTETLSLIGKVKKIEGLLIESFGPRCRVGDLCLIKQRNGKEIYFEVFGLNESYVKLMAYEIFEDIEIGDKVYLLNKRITINLGDELLGRVIDSIGRPIDNKGYVLSKECRELRFEKINPMERGVFSDQIVTGVRVLDGLLPIAKGQRVGIFSSAGLGKSTLLGMIAKNSKADVNVVALIGERGRELNEFIKYELGESGLKKSVVIVSTSDETPIFRYKGAYTATLIAEYFRDKGKDVILFFDSVTRFANAKREIGLFLGEPPVARGYPPSVFSEIPILLERSGLKGKGSITGFFTVLVEGDDFEDPISENIKAVLDGHIMLDRNLLDKGIFPPIDILTSVSRSTHRIVNFENQKLISRVRKLLATYKNYEDLINAGAYMRGADKEVDISIDSYSKIIDFISQEINEKSDFDSLKYEIKGILA